MAARSPVRIKKRPAILLVISLLGLYVVVPQIGDFKKSFDYVQAANFGYLVLAVFATLMTYLAAAGTYYFLAFTKLKYFVTVLVQFASMFINRLLPGGIGALGANYAYLRANKHSVSQSLTVVAVNNAMGTLGHILLLSIFLIWYGDSVPPIHLTASSKIVILGVLSAVGLILGLLIFRGWIDRVKSGIKSFVSQVVSYRHRREALVGALLSSCALTLFNVLSLYLCALALGSSLSFATVFLVFSLGLSLGTATPTPGGLGGFEAGLVAGFVAFHLSSAEGLAIALLYRLISYWLTLLAGAVAFVFAQKQRLFGESF